MSYLIALLRGLFLFLILMPVEGLTAEPPPQTPNVLYFGSFQPGYYWDERVTAAIGEVFQEAGLPINYLTEFIDVRHNPTRSRDEIFTLLFELYKKKYKKIRFDVIIVSYDDALEFLLTYRKELFPDVPIVLSGITRDNREWISRETGITGTVDSRTARRVIDLALTLHPSARNMAVVVDDSIYSRETLKEVMALKKAYRNRVTFIPLVFAEQEPLTRALKGLPKETIILETSYHSSPSPNLFTPRDRKSFVFESTKRPIYSVWNKAVGNGAVAGQAVHPEDHGRGAAEAAIKILQGVSAEAIDIVTIPCRTFLFDYEMLKFFHISETSLPENAIIINKPETFYYRYKRFIAGTLAIIGVLVSVIAVLIQVIRRKRQEKAFLLREIAAKEREETLSAELRQSQTLEALGTFSSGIAHDLNNILGVIDACNSLAQGEIHETSPAIQDLDQIAKATHRGKELVRRIMTFSRRGERHHQPIRLSDILTECVPMLEAQFAPEITIRLINPLPGAIIKANAGEMHQVLMNLGINACQAMLTTGGELLMAVSHSEEGGTISQMTLTISDTGIGMEPEVVDRVFDPFFTTRKEEGGVGLGLSSVHGIIKNHGGTISLESVPGEGTTFTLTLPASPGPLKSTKEAKPTPSPAHGGTILLVDDDKGMIYSVKNLLERAGHRVFSTSDAHKALGWIEKEPGTFDLLISDEIMAPLRGTELLEALRKTGSTLPAIIYSGYIGDEEAAFFETLTRLQAGFITKPFNHADLLAQVAASLPTQREQ